LVLLLSVALRLLSVLEWQVRKKLQESKVTVHGYGDAWWASA
jgi:transposase